MERLRALLESGRNHYEKLVLVLALLGLGITVWILNQVRLDEAAKVQAYFVGIDRQMNKALQPPRMEPIQAAFAVAEKPLSVNFGLPHNLVNPVKWLRKPNGDLLKIEREDEEGPLVMEITGMKELNYIISFERATSSGGYFLGVTREAAEHPFYRRKRPSYATVGTTNEFYTLLKVDGDPKDPSALELELTDTHEQVSIAPDRPYVRVDGYEADLRYPPDGKEFHGVRVGAELHFAGEDYKTVAISSNQVVLLASSNDKKYVIKRRAP